eukprot:SAG31_NODE_7381_length_1704_cov_1.357632_2_plen_172_part_00
MSNALAVDAPPPARPPTTITEDDHNALRAISSDEQTQLAIEASMREQEPCSVAEPSFICIKTVPLEPADEPSGEPTPEPAEEPSCQPMPEMRDEEALRELRNSPLPHGRGVDPGKLSKMDKSYSGRSRTKYVLSDLRACACFLVDIAERYGRVWLVLRRSCEGAGKVQDLS